MILKRCNNGHYYDGEIYEECPECRGAGRGTPMQGDSWDSGDYADEDTVTVALPRAQGRQPAGHAAQAGTGSGAARAAQAASGAARKPSFKPVVGWLVCIQGKDFGSSFTIKLGKNFIGRSADMDIVLHGDESIAMDQHAAIYYVPKQRRFAVEPGMSGKRFFVNRDAVVRPVWIKQHDILQLGNTSLIFFPCCGEHFSWEEIIRRQRERKQGQ